MNYGVFGGAFDPIHNGHLLLAQAAYEQLGLDKVLFIPAYKPLYRDTEASFSQRIILSERALVDDTRFEQCAVPHSYMVETLDCVADIYGHHNWYLILGGDQAAKFFTWSRPDAILSKIKLVAWSERESYDYTRVYDHWGWRGVSDSFELKELNVPTIDFSSSLIRERVRRQKSIRYMVPDSVDSYITATGLYHSTQSLWRAKL